MQTFADVTLFPMALSFILGVVIPHVVDFVTHITAPWWFKSLLATALSVLAGVLSTVEWPGLHDWKVYVMNVGVAFITAFAAQRAGFSVPTRDATSNFGLMRRTF